MTTIIGLVIALIFPAIYSLISNYLKNLLHFTANEFALLGFATYWILAFGILLFVRHSEKKKLLSIGIKSISWKTGALAFVIGIFLSISVPLLSSLANTFLPASESGGILDVASNYPR